MESDLVLLKRVGRRKLAVGSEQSAVVRNSDATAASKSISSIEETPMTTRLFILASLFVLHALVPCADAKISAEAAFAMLHDVSSEGIEVKEPATKATEPKVIADEKELAATFKDEKVLARLKKEVDFSKGKLVFFAWAGSGQDNLTSGLFRGEKGREAVFTYPFQHSGIRSLEFT